MPIIDVTSGDATGRSYWTFSDSGSFSTRLLSTTDDSTYGTSLSSSGNTWGPLPAYSFPSSGVAKLWIRARYGNSDRKTCKIQIWTRSDDSPGNLLVDSGDITTTSSFAMYSYTLTSDDKTAILALSGVASATILRVYGLAHVVVSQAYLEIPDPLLGIEMGCVF